MENEIYDLLTAEKVLAAVSKQLLEEYQAGGSAWPREWMVKHVSDSAAIIKVRAILIDRADAAQKLIGKVQDKFDSPDGKRGGNDGPG